MDSPTEPVLPMRVEADTPTPVTESDLPSTSDSDVSADFFRRNVRTAFLSALAYLALFPISDRLPFSQITILATTLISIPLALLFTVATARALSASRALVLSTVISGLLFVPSVLILLLHARFPTWPVWITIGPSFHAYRTFIKHIPDQGLILIWFAVCTGVWLARLVREMKMLLPIAVVLACVDLYAVFGGGFVQQAVQGTSKVAKAALPLLTAPLPTTHAAPMRLSVGFADYLFIALFFACFARFRIPSRRTFAVLCAVLTGYMTIVYLMGIALPALVPIAAVVIGMNLRAFRYERSEAFALLYASLIAAVIAGGLLFFRSR